MGEKNFLTTIAFIAVAFALFNLIITVQKIGDVKTVTGFAATDTGKANLSIASAIDINFTTDLIDWGSGVVSPSFPYANLNTTGSAGSGNIGESTVDPWNIVTNGLVLVNIGNVNVNLTLESNVNATTFIGTGIDPMPIYQWVLSQVEAGSCSSDVNHATIALNPTGLYRNVTCPGDVGTGSCPLGIGPAISARNVCANFTAELGSWTANMLRLDLSVNVSRTAPVGLKVSTITASAYTMVP